MSALVAFDVVGAGVDRGLEDMVLAAGARRVFDHSLALEASLGEAESVKLGWKPNLTVDVGERDAGTLFKLVDQLEDDDDVQTVWGNYEVADEVMEKLG